MHKYSYDNQRNAFLPIKFQKHSWGFVNNSHTNGGYVAQRGTWFHIYTKNLYTGKHQMSVWGGQRGWARFSIIWKKTAGSRRNQKIILEIRIDICYTDSVPYYCGTDETLPAPRGSVSADKFVRKVSNWKTIPSIS